MSKKEPSVATKTLKWQDYKDYAAYKCEQACSMRPPPGHMMMRSFNAQLGTSVESPPWLVGRGTPLQAACMAAALRVYAEDWEPGEPEGE